MEHAHAPRSDRSEVVWKRAAEVGSRRSRARTCSACEGRAMFDHEGHVQFCPECVEAAHAPLDEVDLGGRD